jgi:hypothetical protein
VKSAPGIFEGRPTDAKEVVKVEDRAEIRLLHRAEGVPATETFFLPGRRLACPLDFNNQLAAWLVRANSRMVRSIIGRPVDLLETSCR